jgi:hypothetical protein
VPDRGDGDPPARGNVYRDKVPAAAAVINGFGKSIGLVQVDELGVLETPIALTNTFSVGALAQAQIRAAIAENPEIGRAWPTVNPLVFECNDGYLNDIQAMAVQGMHYDAPWRPRAWMSRKARWARARHVVVRRQGRYRHRVARCGRLHGRRAGAVELRHGRIP